VSNPPLLRLLEASPWVAALTPEQRAHYEALREGDSAKPQ